MSLACSHFHGVCTSLHSGENSAAFGSEIHERTAPTESRTDTRGLLSRRWLQRSARTAKSPGGQSPLPRRSLQRSCRRLHRGGEVRPEPAAALAEQGLHLSADAGARLEDG